MAEAEAKLRPGILSVIIARFTYHGETVPETADILLRSRHYDLEYVTMVQPLPAAGMRPAE